MIIVDLKPDVIDFLNMTGHSYRINGVTHMCANPFWYKYIGNNEWEVLNVESIPSEIKENYIKYLEDFLIQLKKGYTPTETITINLP